MLNKKQVIKLEKIRKKLCRYVDDVGTTPIPSPITLRILGIEGSLWEVTHTKKNLTSSANKYLDKLYKKGDEKWKRKQK